ncbi:MAG: TerC family protein [candidate division Zixibacteria bacterium]|nr:TerC family protein [candidate division Zixibacteria bacterium]MBU1470475.1 TerC family protein [candidate division Zixibacteria bacterium]MBU2625924.1 TerC family protein [candidate division Zixibacteria bacterium]
MELLANKYFLWIGFNILVLLMLAIDLGFFHRKDHEISIKEALLWSVIWIVVALVFNVGVYFWRGTEVSLQFFTGYVIERTLSIDNIFVFLLIFTYFQVPTKYQYKVLIWGILGALIFRGLFIAVGTILIAKFHWLIYVFGAFLVFTGIRMGFGGDTKVEPERNPILRLVRKLLPITAKYEGGKFFVRRNKRTLGTPLLVVLVVIETTDIVFAVDSIPAIFAITLDPFIVYTSNVFAILGLRALYFAMAGLMKLFYYLRYALAAILSLVGIKMLLSTIYPIPNSIALGTVALLLAASIILSLIFPKKNGETGDKHPEQTSRTA